MVPKQPPALLPGPTAHILTLRLVGTVAALFAVAWFLIPFVFTHGLPGYLIGAGYVFLLAWLPEKLNRNSVDRVIQEADSGYYTQTIIAGSYGFYRRLPSDTRSISGSGRSLRVPWNQAGLWKLNPRTGEVITAPNRSVNPPGYYPSPMRPGELQMWSGAAWLPAWRGELESFPNQP